MGVPARLRPSVPAVGQRPWSKSAPFFSPFLSLLPSRLLVVVMLAQALVVGRVDKLCPVSPVGLDVVHHRCPNVFPLLRTLHTQWVRFQVLSSGSPPPASISSFLTASYRFRMKRLVNITVAFPHLHQCRTAWVLAGYPWFPWHGHHLRCSLIRPFILISGRYYFHLDEILIFFPR